jgi:hypothetical protein
MHLLILISKLQVTCNAVNSEIEPAVLILWK